MNQIQKNEIDIFLKRMAKIFKNEDAELNSDTIYHELTNHFIKDNKYCKISPLEVDDIINALQEKYSKVNVKGLDVWTEYFLIFDNCGDLNYDDFYNSLQEKSLKLYVAVDEKSLLNTANKVYDFILENNIIVQSKIAFELRSDVFVIRVVNYSDAIKIINFINSLKYETKYKPNPFSFSIGKVSITKDYGTSYNRVVTLILQKYLNQKKNLNELDKVCYDNFAEFIRMKCYNEETYQHEKNMFERALKIKEYTFQSDFYVACYDLLRRNIEDELTLETFENHKLLDSIIKENNIKVDKNDNITDLGINYKLIEDVFNCFLECIKDTYQKYNKEQAYQAITNLIINRDYSYITDEKENRTKLMNIVSYNELIKIINYVMRENGYSVDDIIDLAILEENKKGRV